MNPGDLRVARVTCGLTGCHPTEVAAVEKSMMTHGGHAVGRRALQQRRVPDQACRGSARATDPTARPSALQTVPPPTPEEIVKKGVLPFLDPLPRFEVGQPGNILRVFERGQRKPLEIGLPIVDEDPAGRPTG